MRLTFVELLIVLFIVGFYSFCAWVLYKLFHQTDVVGAIQWGVLTLALAVGGSASGTTNRSKR